MSILRNATAKRPFTRKQLPFPKQPFPGVSSHLKGGSRIVYFMTAGAWTESYQLLQHRPRPICQRVGVVNLDIVLCCTLHIDPDLAHLSIWWGDKCVAAPALLSTEFGTVPPGLWRPCKSPEKRNITLLERWIRQQKRMVMFIDINWINKQDNKFGIAAEITWKCCILNFTYFIVCGMGCCFMYHHLFDILIWYDFIMHPGKKKEEKKNYYQVLDAQMN